MSSPAIEMRNVTRTYPGNPPIHALNGVNVAIQPGEMVAVVGPSGSGKSTMLNIMGTLDRPTDGTVLIDGIDTRSLSERQLCRIRSSHLGFVFQGFHLLESVSILDNVANGLLYRGTGRRKRRTMAQDALDLVELGHRSDARPAALSGGQRQRVAIARAIVGNPTLVLADEPTGNLDSATSDSILTLLHDLNETHGATIVLITHDAEVAARAQRQITVHDGKVSCLQSEPDTGLIAGGVM